MNGEVKRFAKWVFRIILLAVLAVGCVLVFLDLHGFPPVLVDLVARQFAQAGYRMQVSSIHFDWSRGVVASDLVLADARTPDEPLGRVDEVQLQIDLRRLWQERNAIRGLRIANANLALPISAENQAATQFTTEGAHAILRFDEDGTIRIEQLVGVYCGINLRVRGSIKPSKASRLANEQRDLRGRFGFVTKALSELNTLTAAEPPQLNIDFDLDLARPWAGEVNVKLEGQKVQYRGLLVDSIWVDLAMREAAIKIKACELLVGNGALSVSGDYDVGQGQFDLQLASTIHPSSLASLLPEKAAQVLREVRVGQRPKLVARYLLSPQTGTEPKLSGLIELANLELRGVEFDSVRAELEKVGTSLLVRDALITQGAGRLRGQGQYDLSNTSFKYSFESTLNPGNLLAFMPPGVRNFVAPSWFEHGPHIRAEVTGDFVDPEKFAYDATINTRQGSYRGVGFRSASAQLQLRRNQLSAQQIVFRRSDGEVRGEVQVDFPRQQVRFDLRSTANPVPLAPMLGPTAAAFAENYEFGAGTRGSAMGLADFHDPLATAWTAEFTNRQVRAYGLVAEQARARLVFASNSLHLVAHAKAVQHGTLRSGTTWAELTITSNAVQAVTQTSQVDNGKVRADQAWAEFTVISNHVAGVASATNLVAWGLSAQQATGAFRYVQNQLTLTTTAQQLSGWSLRAATARAQVQASTNLVQAAIDTTGFGWWRLTADSARGDLVLSNDLLQVNNFEGKLYGGRIRGAASFDGRSNSPPYLLQLTVERSDVEKMVEDMREPGEASGRRMNGWLHGELHLQGEGASSTNITGKGQMSISDGVIWRAALFGPLSHVLGETRATDAKCSFNIANRTLRTEDIEVAAGAFSAKSRGSVDFDGKLDFRVQAQFLRSWPGINLLTVLLGKALEYKVGGTLADPSYRAVNLPKELLPHD